MWLKADPKNIQYCREIIAQNKKRRAMLDNEFGAMTKCPKDMRLGLSIPTDLYYLLDQYERMHGDERKFLESNEDFTFFAKHFPQFVVPSRV
jgi:hypothetical protein